MSVGYIPKAVAGAVVPRSARLTTATAEQRLQKAVYDIIQNEQYTTIIGVIMIGTKTIEDDMPTACTNGRDEIYGREWIDTHTDAEVRYTVLHENWHKMLQHLKNYHHLMKICPQTANIALDHVINLNLNKEDCGKGFVKMPDGCMADFRFEGMTEQQVFNILYQERQDDGGGSDSGGDGDGDGGFDFHDWKGANKLSDEEQRSLEREIEENIRQGLLAGGTGSGGSKQYEKIVKSQLDWHEILREFITTLCVGNDYSSWRKPNRRYLQSGEYRPSGVSDQVSELCVAIDTSGSIGTRELSVFLSEIKSICETVKPNLIRVLYWDTEVRRAEQYKTHELDTMISQTKPDGGGGTDVTCVPEYLAEHNILPQAVVVLTDGHLYGGWGLWNTNVLWCILDNERAAPDTGKAIHIKSHTM